MTAPCLIQALNQGVAMQEAFGFRFGAWLVLELPKRVASVNKLLHKFGKLGLGRQPYDCDVQPYVVHLAPMCRCSCTKPLTTFDLNRRQPANRVWVA
jgi:hypothetical protein